jgi:hypothetical protein
MDANSIHGARIRSIQYFESTDISDGIFDLRRCMGTFHERVVVFQHRSLGKRIVVSSSGSQCNSGMDVEPTWILRPVVGRLSIEGEGSKLRSCGRWGDCRLSML